MQITIRMRKVKTTKNTVVYEPVSDGKAPFTRSLYVENWVNPPAEITLTLDTANGVGIAPNAREHMVAQMQAEG